MWFIVFNTIQSEYHQNNISNSNYTSYNYPKQYFKILIFSKHFQIYLKFEEMSSILSTSDITSKADNVFNTVLVLSHSDGGLKVLLHLCLL